MHTRLLIPMIVAVACGTPVALAHAHAHDRDHEHGHTHQQGQAAQADVTNRARLHGRANEQLRRARRLGEHDALHSAGAIFTELLAADPDDRAARYGLVHTLVGHHLFEDALREARRIAEREPDRASTWALLGDVHFALGNDVEAEALYRRLADDGLTLESLARLGLILQRRGRPSEAAAHFRDAVEAGRLLSSSPQERAWCATMLADVQQEAGDLAAAETTLTEALALDPSAHGARHAMADIRCRRGDAETAIEMLETLISESPLPTYRISLGHALLAAGRPGEADLAFMTAEHDLAGTIGAGDVGHARELVELWLDRGGDVDRAVELALHDLEHVRRDPEAFETAAWALYRAGRLDEANAHITIAVERRGSPRMRERARQIRSAQP